MIFPPSAPNPFLPAVTLQTFPSGLFKHTHSCKELCKNDSSVIFVGIVLSHFEIGKLEARVRERPVRDDQNLVPEINNISYKIKKTQVSTKNPL